MTKKTTAPADDMATRTETFAALFNAITPFPTVAGAIFKLGADLERTECSPVPLPKNIKTASPGPGLSKAFRAAVGAVGLAVGFGIPMLTTVLAFNGMANYDIGPLLTPLLAGAGIMASIPVGAAVIGVSQVLAK